MQICLAPIFIKTFLLYGKTFSLRSKGRRRRKHCVPRFRILRFIAVWVARKQTCRCCWFINMRTFSQMEYFYEFTTTSTAFGRMLSKMQFNRWTEKNFPMEPRCHFEKHFKILKYSVETRTNNLLYAINPSSAPGLCVISVIIIVIWKNYTDYSQ